jgi:hypothetical protein
MGGEATWLGTPIGTFGDITYVKTPNGQVRARTRFRDDVGQVRRVSATGSDRKSAERALMAVLAQISRLRTSRLTRALTTSASRCRCGLCKAGREGPCTLSSRSAGVACSARPPRVLVVERPI